MHERTCGVEGVASKVVISPGLFEALSDAVSEAVARLYRRCVEHQAALRGKECRGKAKFEKAKDKGTSRSASQNLTDDMIDIACYSNGLSPEAAPWHYSKGSDAEGKSNSGAMAPSKGKGKGKGKGSGMGKGS